MAVEIKELVVRAVVREEAKGSEGKGKAAPATADTQAMVQMAVAEVLRILKSAKER